MTDPLSQLTPLSNDLERALRNLYPKVAASLDRTFRTDRCGDCWRVMQHGRPDTAEYFSSESEANDARRAHILQLLILWHNWQTTQPYGDAD